MTEIWYSEFIKNSTSSKSFLPYIVVCVVYVTAREDTSGS